MDIYEIGLGLRNLLLFFSDVNEINLRFVNWNQHYNRSNQSYQMLIGICYLVYNGLLQTQTDGTTRIMDFFDEQHMCHLYEKFLLEYYRNGIVKKSVVVKTH